MSFYIRINSSNVDMRGPDAQEASDKLWFFLSALFPAAFEGCIEFRVLNNCCGLQVQRREGVPPKFFEVF